LNPAASTHVQTRVKDQGAPITKRLMNASMDCRRRVPHMYGGVHDRVLANIPA
jgi:hypothetical protein